MKRIILCVCAAILAACALYIPASAEGLLPEMRGEAEFNAIAEDIFSGNFRAEPQTLMQKALDIIGGEIPECAAMMLSFLAAGAMTAILGAFGGNNAAAFAVTTLMSGTALKCFFTVAQCGKDVIDAMCAFITKLAPMMIMLLMTGGKAVSAAAFHPVLSAAVYIITLLCQKCIMPLIYTSAVLGVANNINPGLRISNMCRLVNSLTKWILTAVFTLFTGISAIYGFSAPALDAVGAKAAKFAAGSLVPIVGGFLSDSLDAVVAGARLAGSAVGTAGMILLALTAAVPLAKIAVMLLMMKLTAAILEPVADKRISGLLWDVSESVTVVLAMVITVMIMFIAAVTIILSAMR